MGVAKRGSLLGREKDGRDAIDHPRKRPIAVDPQMHPQRLFIETKDGFMHGIVVAKDFLKRIAVDSLASSRASYLKVLDDFMLVRLRHPLKLRVFDDIGEDWERREEKRR